MVGCLGSRWPGRTRTMKCHPMCAIRDPDFLEGRKTGSHRGYWLWDDLGEGAKNSCLWIHTVQGYVAKLG